MKGSEGAARKIRCDKKYGIDTVLGTNAYEILSQLSYIADKPMKDVGESLAVNALSDERVMSYLARKYFRRPYAFNDRLVMGGDLANQKYIIPAYATERLQFRVLGDVREQMDEFSFALGSSSIRAAAHLLISKAAFSHTMVTGFLAAHTPRDQKRAKKARVLLTMLLRSSTY